jgi:WS/DGAT/MGAT family acyltransferase
MRVPLDPDRPLWQMYFVEDFQGGSALISRLSHALADGYALMQVMKETTDDCPDAPMDKYAGQAPEAVEYEPDFLVDTIVQALDTFDGAVSRSKSLLRQGLDLARHPTRLAGLAGLGVSGALSLGKLLLIPPDPWTALKGRCTTAKRAVASQAIPLAEIKAVGKALGATINDVILSGVTGGFRRYLLEKGEHIEGASIRALVPVYLLKNGSAGAQGNGFGLVYLPLPVGIDDPLERLKKLHENMDAIKHTPEAAVAYGILAGLGPVPGPVTRTIAGVFGLKGTAVMTNVPGPKERLYLAGSPIRRVLFWVPQPAGLAVGVSILSYAGEVSIGLATDARVVPDPELIMDGFCSDFETLRQLAQQVSA